MARRIGIFIHFNLNAEPITADTMAGYLHSLVSCLMDGQTPFQIETKVEFVDDYTGKSNKTVSNAISLDELEDSIDSKTCFISVWIANKEAGFARTAGCITRANNQLRFMVGHEQTLIMHVDCKLWNKRSKMLTDCIREFCCDSHVSYVAIDKDYIFPQTIYCGNLRILTKPSISAPKIDPESRVPGIYWAQYISDSMLTGEIKSKILSGSPDAGIGYICKEIGSGLWIQTTPRINADSYEHHKLLYTLLEPQTYTVDKDEMREYLRLEPWLFEKYPIRIDE